MHKLLLPALAVCGLLLVGVRDLRADDPQARASIGIGVEQTRQGAAHPGLMVRELQPNGPAMKAGMKAGDVMTKIDDQSLNNYDDLVNFVAKHKPGDKVAIHVFRDNEQKTLNVTLGERPAAQRLQAGQPGTQGRAMAFLGVQTEPLTAENRGQGAKGGVMVKEVLPNTPASKAGLQTGDVITSFNGRTVADPEALREDVHNAGIGKQVTLKVMRDNKEKDLTAKLEEAPSGTGFFPPPMGNYGNQFGAPPFFQDLQKIPELERRVNDLEKRVRELEQHRSPPPPNK